MLSVALRPKYLGILALMVLATLVCGLLATWQWNRALESREVTSTVQEAAPVELETLLDVGEPVTNNIQGRLVRVTGQFHPEQQAVSPGRRIDGTNAAIVVTNFEITRGSLAGVYVPVARGFTEEAPSAVNSVPNPPRGEVSLVARLEASEGASEGLGDQGEYPFPVIDTISTPMLINMWSPPMLASYLALTEPALTAVEASDPALATELASGLQPLPAAQSQFSSGLNLQNFGYMIQWILFGVFFLYIWWRTVRTQYLEEREARRLEVEKLANGDVNSDVTGD